jgi:hypothetical protein
MIETAIGFVLVEQIANKYSTKVAAFAILSLDGGAVARCLKNASVGNLWTEHQRRIQALEAYGKRIDRQIGFHACPKISRIC